jgi:hypothetical protein
MKTQRKSKHNKQPSTPQQETIQAEALQKHVQHNPGGLKGTIFRVRHPHRPHQEECLDSAWEEVKANRHTRHCKHYRLATAPHLHQQTEPK